MSESPPSPARFDPRGAFPLVCTLAALLALFYWRLPSLGGLYEYPELRAQEPVKALLQDSLFARTATSTPQPIPAEWGCELCDRAGVRQAWDRLELLLGAYEGRPPFIQRALEAFPRAKAISLAAWGDAASLEVVPDPTQAVQALAADASDPLFGVHMVSPIRVNALGWSWMLIDLVTAGLALVLFVRLRHGKPAPRTPAFGVGEATSLFIWAFGAAAASYAALDWPEWLGDWYPVADAGAALVIAGFVWQGRSWRELGRGLGLTWCGTWKVLAHTVIVVGVVALFGWIIELPLMALGQASPWPHASGDLLLYGSTQDKLVRCLSAVVTAPLYEEVMFTGLLFGGLITRFSFRSSALITATLFAAEHALDSLGTVEFIVGSMASCWAFWRTGSIWPSVLAHAALNALYVSVVLA